MANSPYLPLFIRVLLEKYPDLTPAEAVQKCLDIGVINETALSRCVLRARAAELMEIQPIKDEILWILTEEFPVSHETAKGALYVYTDLNISEDIKEKLLPTPKPSITIYRRGGGWLNDLMSDLWQLDKAMTYYLALDFSTNTAKLYLESVEGAYPLTWFETKQNWRLAARELFDNELPGWRSKVYTYKLVFYSPINFIVTKVLKRK